MCLLFNGRLLEMSPISLKNPVITKWLIKIPDLEHRPCLHLMRGKYSASALALELTCSQLCLPKRLRKYVLQPRRAASGNNLLKEVGLQKMRWLDEVSSLLQYSLVRRIAELEFMTCCEQEVSGTKWVWCSTLKQLVQIALKKIIMIALQLWSKIWVVFPSWLIHFLWTGR